MSTNHLPAPLPPKQKILNAAEGLFMTQGFRSTTIADIAYQAEMSPANLYRHYENKENIAAACVEHCLDEKNQMLRRILQSKHTNTATLLEAFVIALLRHTHDKAMSSPKFHEMCDAVMTLRPQVIHTMMSNLQAMFAEILARGNAKKEFDVENITLTAETLFTTLSAFSNPQVMHLYPLPEFERHAHEAVLLLLRGLSRR
jgi:TetR/AcrR family transcriptional regulator, repressor of the ameABC operon